MSYSDFQVTVIQGVIAAAKARGLPRAAAEAAFSVIIAETGGIVMYANDGMSTLTDAYTHQQIPESARAIARESLNYPHQAIGRDLDSVGLYQQRNSTGWGAVSEMMSPELSTGKFFDGCGGNKGLIMIAAWWDLPPWQAGQKVQGSLPKDAWLYSDAYPQAVAIVDQFWGSDAPAEFDLLRWLSEPSYN